MRFLVVEKPFFIISEGFMVRILLLPFRMFYRLLQAAAESHPAVYSFSPAAPAHDR